MTLGRDEGKAGKESQPTHNAAKEESRNLVGLVRKSVLHLYVYIHA